MAQLSGTISLLTVQMIIKETTRQTRREARDGAIRKEFFALYETKKLRADAASEELAAKFFLSPETIMAIAFQWGYYQTATHSKART
jgi:hypothetical protein